MEWKQEHMTDDNLNIVSISEFTNFRPIFPFYNSLKISKKTFFVVFFGGIENEYWPEMSQKENTLISKLSTTTQVNKGEILIAIKTTK